MCKKVLILISALCLMFCLNGKLKSAEDLWEDDWGEESSSWIGFLEYGFGNRFEKDLLFNDQASLNEARFYLENEWQTKSLTWKVKTDISYDGVLNKWRFVARELTANFSAFGNSDFKIGRQVSTWGTGDLLFLNDQFPKAWNTFFNGRDDVYIKSAANAIRITSYFDLLNVDLVWTPEFAADDYINGDRFSFFSPQLGQNIGGLDVIDEQEPSADEIAVRLFKQHKGIEYAVYGYKGFDKRPLGLTTNFEQTFHKRNVIGVSVRSALGGGIFNFEIAYENALQDPKGDNPLVNNSLTKYLVGYESEWLPKLNIGFQLYRESIQDYAKLIANSTTPNLETEKNRDWLTNRIRYTALQDKLTFNLFSFYSLTDKDYFLRWNLNYRQNDQWNYTLGINQIGGPETNTFFAQFEKASNAYFRVRYIF